MEIVAIKMNETNRKYYWDKKYKKEWDELVNNAPRYDAVEYFKKYKKPKGYEIIIFGRPETIEEKLVEAFYDSDKLTYISASDSFPEDFVEERTSFDTMISYADEMKYFIEGLLDMI